MKKDRVFVYGSLRSGFHHPAFEYISRYFSFVGKAKVKGAIYDAGDYPAAVPATEESFIIGELYQIKNEDEFNWAIAQLDDYEGSNVEEGEQPLFKRELTDVYTDDSTNAKAWVYWYNGDIAGKIIITSGDALQYYQEKNTL